MIGARPFVVFADNRGPNRLHHHRSPAAADDLVRRVETGALLGIAAEQCDAFGVLAQTRQGIPVIGFRLTSALSQR